MINHSKQQGIISGVLVASIVLGVLALIFGSVMIYALVNYNDQKNNVDSKKQVAAQDARANQKVADEKAFQQQEKEPLKEFVGPVDLGRVDFKYPKTWSVYVEKDGSTGAEYAAYFHPEEVPPVSAQNRFALRVSIINQSYAQVLQQYAGLVKVGKLRSSAITASGFNGTRFDGNLTQDVEGSVAVFKIRDKTLVLATDAPSFRPDFDGKILKTLTFSQ